MLFLFSTPAISQNSEAENLLLKAELCKSRSDYDSALFYTLSSLKLNKKQDLHLEVKALNNLGFFYSLSGNLIAADSSLILASEILNSKSFPSEKANNVANRGIYHYIQGNYTTALSLSKEALILRRSIYTTAHKDIANNLNNIGILYELLGEYDSSFISYKESLSVNEQLYNSPHPEIANGYNNLGNNAYYTGNYNLAEENFKKALKMFTLLYGENHPDVAGVYVNFGLILLDNNHIEEALNYILKAKNIYEGSFSGNNYNLMKVYMNLGGIYGRKNDNKLALFYLEEGAKKFIETFGDNHPQLAGIYRNIAIVYDQLDESIKSISYLNKALYIYQDVYGSESIETGSTLNSLGILYMDIDLDSAGYFLNKALETKIKAVGENHPALTYTYSYLSILNDRLGQEQKSLEYIQQGIISNSYNFKKLEIEANPDVSDAKIRADYIYLFNSKAEILLKRYKETKDITNLHTAWELVKKNDTLFNQLRHQMVSTNDQLDLNIYTRNNTINSQNICYEYYLQGKNEYLDSAFYYSERGKAAVLLKAIKEVNAKKYANIPSELTEKEDSIKRTLDELQFAIVELMAGDRPENNIEYLQDLRNKEFDLRQHHNQFLKDLSLNFPEYYKLKHDQSVVNRKQLFESLLIKKSRAALISYTLSKENIYIHIITPKKSEFLKIAIDEDIDRLIRGFRNAILYKLDDFDYVSQLLGNYLTQPVLDYFEKEKLNVKELLIIPDGSLNYLPFEALMDKNGEYLINRFNVRYSSSASLAFQKYNDVNQKPSKAYIAFAPTFKEDDSRKWLVASSIKSPPNFYRSGYITPLPGTETEVKNISSLFGRKNLFSKYFLLEQALESEIKKKELADYQYIHIATHGFVNDEFPELSGLVLMKDSVQSKDDGILYTSEIFSIPINADLVVLSACETGLGKIIEGEGVIGLTRAFLYAGAKNIMVSLWQVSDESTSELMILFYNDLLSGQSRSVALSNAKRKLLQSKGYNHPFHWAPFVLSGY